MPAPGAITTQPNTARNQAQTNRNRVVSDIAAGMSSGSGDVTAGLDAIIAAINAKPSA